jgi:large subunit ribosomal protein L24
MKIKRGDMVVVIAGDQASRTPHKVTSVLGGGRQVLIEGVNRVFKHVKRGHPKSPQGGRLNLETPIDSCKVMLYCGSCNKGVRVGFRFLENGVKERFCKSCGNGLGTVGSSKGTEAAAS